jgi:flagellar protein FlaG
MKIEGIQSVGQKAAAHASNGHGSQEAKVSTTKQQESFPFSERQYTEEQVMKAIERANKSFESFGRRFEISVHDRLKNAIMIKVIDSSNDEVIREIPSKKLLDMVANMLEVAGLLVDKRG